MMDRYAWIWVAWLLALIGSFAILEGYAIITHHWTLSRFTYNLSVAWPLMPWACGVLVGGLAVHFWWHWSP